MLGERHGKRAQPDLGVMGGGGGMTGAGERTVEIRLLMMDDFQGLQRNSYE